MESLLDLLSPEQIDAILATYDTVALWYDQAIINITGMINQIVVDDVVM